MKAAALFLLALAGCAQQSEEAKIYQAFADDFNGDLRALRLTALSIRSVANTALDTSSVPNAVSTTSQRAVVNLCGSMDGAIRRLESRGSARDLRRVGGAPLIEAASMISGRSKQCADPNAWKCRHHCVDAWAWLSDSVDAIRESAKEHGVHVESLLTY